MVKFRNTKERKDVKPPSLDGIKYRPISEATQAPYEPKSSTIAGRKIIMARELGIDLEEEEKKEKLAEARAKALKLPKLDMEKIRNSSSKYDPYAEYLSREETSANNKQAHIDAGLQEESKKEVKLPFFNNTSQDGKPKATMSGTRNKPNENQKASLQVGGDTIHNQNRKATTESGKSYMTDGDIKSSNPQDDNKIEFRSDRAKSLVQGIKDIPRNLGAGVVQALDTGAELLTSGQHNNAYKARTEEDWKNANTPFKTYEEYLANIDKLNEGVAEQKGTVGRIASPVTDETTFTEKAIRAAALNLPSSFLTAGLGGLGAGVAQGLTKNKIIIEGARNLPLFGSGLNSGLEQADQIGLTGAKKYSYGIASGIIETATERMSMLGFEGQLMGKATKGATGGFAEGIRGLIEEPLTEGINSIAQQVLTGAYTNMEDFELDMEEIQLSMASAFLMSGVNVSGTFKNGIKYKTVGVENGMVLMETEDGRIEPVTPEIVAKHQLEMTRPEYENVKKAYTKQNMAEMFEQYSNDETEQNISDTMPLEAPATTVEQSNVETDNSAPKEVEVATEDVKRVETEEPIINELDKDVEDYYTQDPKLAFESDEGADLAEVNLEKAQKSIRKVLAKNSTFEVKRDGVIRFTVHKSNKGNGKYQLTSYDNKGEPLSDSQLSAKELVEEVIYYQIRPSEMIAPELETAQPTTDGTYTYQYRLRGFSPGAQPSGVISNNEADGKYGSITYDRPLTAKELSDYELDVVRESKPKLTTPKINDNKSITPKNMETRQTAEAKLDNMIKNKLIDSTKNRSVAEALNRQIVDLGGKDRSKDFEKVVAPKVKKAKETAIPSDGKYTVGQKLTESVYDNGSTFINTEYEVVGYGTEWQGTKLSDKPGYIVRENSPGSDYKTVSILDESTLDMVETNNKNVQQKVEAETEKQKAKDEKNAKYEETYKLDAFTKSNTPMQKGKIMSTLSKKLNYSGKTMTRAEFVYDSIVNKDKELFTKMNKKFNEKTNKYEETVPYYGIRDEDNSYNVITKAEYDYAQFLKGNEAKTVKVPTLKKAETITVESDTMQTNNMTSSDEVSDVLYPGEGDRVFKTRQSKKTLMESDKISQTMKDRVIEDDPALYETRKQQGVIIETKMDIQKTGYDNMYKEILAKVDEGDALSNDYDRAMLASMMEENQKLRVKHNDNGFYQDQFDKIYKIYAETGTENARGLAMQGQLVNTPIGKAMQSKREVEKHRTEEQGKLVDDIDKVVEELFIEDDLVDVEKVGKKLEKSFKLPKAWIEQLKKDIADESLSKTQVKERLAQQLKVPTLTQVEFDEVTKIAEELDKLDPKSETYKKDQKELTDKIRRMIDQKNITFWQKVSSIQTMAMLMNVKTTVRNEVGNFLGFGTGQIDDVFSYLFDMPISAFTKQQGVLVPELDFRKYKWGKNAIKSLTLYNDQTMSDNKYQKKKVFTPGSNMAKLEGILSVMLSDARHKQSRLDMMEGQIPKTERRAEKKGLKFDPESHRAEFNYYADYSTFNFDSGLAKWLDGIVKKTNEYTPFIHDKDFGLGTILAKFAKTPMNIVQYQLDHLGGDLLREGVRTSRLANKVGLANAITQNQTRISRSLGKTATGASYIALGALLSNLGGFIDEEEDEDVKALLEANGVKGSYFNFTALRRSIFGGDPAYQEGDSTIDIKWMLPVAPFLILGSRLAKAKDEGEADTIMASLQTTVETMGASMSDFAELPFNRTLGILTSPYYSGMDKFNKILSGTVTGFIPSPVKQLAQGLDPTSKTYSKNTAIAFGQQIKANIPLLRNTVPARFDVKGEPITFVDNTTVGWDIFEMFFNPAYRDKIKGDKVLTKILDANEKGNVPSLPKVTKDSFGYGGTEYKMTPEQHKQYQKDYFEAYKKFYTKKNQDGNIMNAHDRASEEAKIKFMKENKIRYQTTDSGRLKLPTVKK